MFTIKQAVFIYGLDTTSSTRIKQISPKDKHAQGNMTLQSSKPSLGLQPCILDSYIPYYLIIIIIIITLYHSAWAITIVTIDVTRGLMTLQTVNYLITTDVYHGDLKIVKRIQLKFPYKAKGSDGIGLKTGGYGHITPFR